MPVYEFLCRDCDHRYEDLVPMSTELLDQACPECRSGDVAKLYSPFSVSAKRELAGVGASCGGGACLPGPAGASAGRSGGCCGGGCGGCG
jgi:putative FmdB family regulatory protein